MSDALSVQLDDLRTALVRVLDAVEARHGPLIDLDADYYSEVSLDSAYSQEPRIEIGQLSDDVDSLRELLARDATDEVFVWHDLGHLVGILRRLAALDVPPKPRPRGRKSTVAAVSDAAKDGTRRRYEERQGELRGLIWEWDPLGLMGVALDIYDSLVDGVLSALTGGGTDTEVEQALRSGLVYMVADGYSASAAARESEPSALLPVVRGIRAWWESAPSRPPPAA
jgi:hypothetical protein